MYDHFLLIHENFDRSHLNSQFLLYEMRKKTRWPHPYPPKSRLLPFLVYGFSFQHQFSITIRFHPLLHLAEIMTSTLPLPAVLFSQVRARLKSPLPPSPFQLSCKLNLDVDRIVLLAISRKSFGNRLHSIKLIVKSNQILYTILSTDLH